MNLDQYLDQTIDVELSGKIICTGYLIDYGPDILVIYNGHHYQYLPMEHVQHLSLHVADSNEKLESPQEQLTVAGSGTTLTYREILTNAKGLFLEISINGRQPIHGYLSSLMDDYVVFQSHVYQTLYISIDHIKWLIPFAPGVTPYGANLPRPALSLVATPPALTFEQNLQNLVGRLVVFDLGEEEEKVGYLSQMAQPVIELVRADGQKVYWNTKHLKTVHVPQ